MVRVFGVQAGREEVTCGSRKSVWFHWLAANPTPEL